MSAESYRRDTQRHQAEIGRLQRQKADEAKRAADYSKRSAEAATGAARASSASWAQSKLRDAERYRNEHTRALAGVADCERRIAQEQERLAFAQQNLARCEAADRDRKERDAARQRARDESRHRETTARLKGQEQKQQETEATLRRLQVPPERIIVLMLASNPLNENQLRLDEEARAIAGTIRMSKHRESVKLESCWAVRPQDVLQAVNEQRPTVVHFSGHGSRHDEIVFQDDNGESKYVSREAMVQLIGACSGAIRLAFFNTCFSQRQAEDVVRHIDAAIGMKTTIGDEAARVFAAQFYSGIGFGFSIRKAFDQARALVMVEGLGEEDSPSLFTRPGLDPDTVLLVQASESATRNV